MDSFPVEIKRMIAFQLRNCDENPHGPRDIKCLRLIDRQFSILGAEFLLPEIHLTFRNRSFERLQAISQHPVFSKQVTRLIYEADAYRNSASERTWMKNQSKAGLFDIDLFDASETDAYFKGLEMYPAYRVICSEQNLIRHQNDAYNCQLIAEAIARLPKLTEITLAIDDHEVSNRTNTLIRAYADTYRPPAGDDGHSFPFGVMQLCSLLYATDAAGVRLTRLDFGKIDWKLFQLDSHKMDRTKRALRHLQTLSLSFYFGYGYLDADEMINEWEEFSHLLLDYRMVEFLSAAKDLRNLDLNLDHECGIELEWIVGDTTWESLTSVDLGDIFTSEETLVKFVERHAGTLTELGLHDITMLNGDWMSMLPRIRNALELEDFRASGRWSTELTNLCWDIRTPSDDEELQEDDEEEELQEDGEEHQESTLSQDFKLGMAVKKYILKGGDCPLLDTVTYPQHRTLG